MTEDVRFDYSKTMAELQETQVDTINPYGFSGVTAVHGYMNAYVGVKPQIKIGRRFEPRINAWCLWYDSINVDLTISPTVVIAREIYQNPCLRQSTTEHEMKHVNMDRKIVNKYARIIGQKIYDALAERGFRSQPVSPEYIEGMNERMGTVISQIIAFEHDKMQLERLEAQRAIDNVEEYDRISKTCPEARAKLPQWQTQLQKPKAGTSKSYGAGAPGVYRP